MHNYHHQINDSSMPSPHSTLNAGPQHFGTSLSAQFHPDITTSRSATSLNSTTQAIVPKPAPSLPSLPSQHALFHEGRASSTDSLSESSFGSSSTLTCGNNTGITYAIRQPLGPRDPGKDVGFDWNSHHARRHARINKIRRQQKSTTINSNPVAATSRPIHKASILWAGQRQTSPMLQTSTSVFPQATVPSYLNHGPAYSQEPTSTPHFSNSLRPGPSQGSDAPIVLNNDTISGFFAPMSDLTGSQRDFASTDQAAYQPLCSSSSPHAILPFSTGLTLQHPQPKVFFRSTMALEREGLAVRDPHHLAPGSSYKGNIWAASYLDQVENLPDIENAALWIEHLPPDTPHSVIFDNVCNGAGTVWSLHLNPKNQTHSTMAAKLVFTKPESAAVVMRRDREFGINLGGNWLRVKYNKFGMRAKDTTETRVLRIEGPAEIMTWEFWKNYFRGACSYQMDRWFYLPSPRCLHDD